MGEKRDQLGMKMLVLDWKIGEQEKHTTLRLQEILDAHLIERGIGKVIVRLEENDALPYTDASHHIGTTRISDDPQKGVVDRHCRVHGVKNLYITGSSIFPTGGHANPTLTTVALVLRLANYLKRHT